MPDGETIFRFFEALPAIVCCALGFYVLWGSIFFRDVRLGMSRKNPPVHGLLAFVARAFVAMIALYAILIGGKIALERLSLWPSLSRRLSLTAGFPIGTIVQMTLVVLFSAMAVNGVTLLIKRNSDWKTRMIGSALLLGCSSVAFAIVHFWLCAL